MKQKQPSAIFTKKKTPFCLLRLKIKFINDEKFQKKNNIISYILK